MILDSRGWKGLLPGSCTMQCVGEAALVLFFGCGCGAVDLCKIANQRCMMHDLQIFGNSFHMTMDHAMMTTVIESSAHNSSI